jgi:hypothetical protein
MIQLKPEDFSRSMLATRAAARYCGRARLTFIRWRAKKRGPPCAFLNGAWQYPIKHLDAWLAALEAAKRPKPSLDQLMREALAAQSSKSKSGAEIPQAMATTRGNRASKEVAC